MFFDKLKREMAIHYSVQVSLLLLAYFVVTPGSFSGERFTLFSPFGLWHQLSPLIIPLTLILSVINGCLLISALSTLQGRRPKRRDFLVYITTSGLFILLYLLSAAILYIAFSPLLIHLRLTATTEIPVLIGYLTLILLILLLWKWLTYVKWRCRITHFRQKDPLPLLKTIFAGFSGALNWKNYLIFLAIVSATLGLPLLLLALGAYLQSAPLLASSLMVGILCFTIGKFYMLYTLWNQMET